MVAISQCDNRSGGSGSCGGLADQTYDIDTAIPALDVSGDFTGNNISYALAPASAALPAGIVTGTPTVVATQVSVIVRGTNSGGFADTGFGITIEDATSGFAVEEDGLEPVITATGGNVSVTIAAGVYGGDLHATCPRRGDH